MYVNVYTCILICGVSFAEYSLFYRALLQKRPIIFHVSRRHAIPVSCHLDVCIITHIQV